MTLCYLVGTTRDSGRERKGLIWTAAKTTKYLEGTVLLYQPEGEAWGAPCSDLLTSIWEGNKTFALQQLTGKNKGSLHLLSALCESGSFWWDSRGAYLPVRAPSTHVRKGLCLAAFEVRLGFFVE